MRTRNKKYSDYGMSMEEVKNAYDWLNNCSASDKEHVHNMVSEQLPPAVAEYVYLALTEHRGYWNLYGKGLDYSKNDFYGYKRKGLYLVNEKIIKPID